MKFHEECAAPEIIDLLSNLVKKEVLINFFLGGGTSLALRFGHRKSIDIDLFTDKEFNSLNIQNEPDPVYMNGWDWEFVRDKMETIAKKLVR